MLISLSRLVIGWDTRNYSGALAREIGKKFPPSMGLDLMAGEGERLEIKRFELEDARRVPEN
jgi:hypothetical protein